MTDLTHTVRLPRGTISTLCEAIDYCLTVFKYKVNQLQKHQNILIKLKQHLVGTWCYNNLVDYPNISLQSGKI